MGVSRNDEGAARPAPATGAAVPPSGTDGGTTTPGDPVGGAAPAGGGGVPGPDAAERAALAVGQEVDDAVEAALAEAVHPRSPATGGQPEPAAGETDGRATSGPETPDTVGADARAAALGQPVKVDAGDCAPSGPEAGSPNGNTPRVEGGQSKSPSRRPPALTRDTARPEGGGRAAPSDASAPARQWPLLTVLGLAGLGLVIVASDAFADAFRVGAILIGVALVTGAVMRRVLPSVGMLAVRSRFTDMVTYGLLGTLIVLLALVTQPKPWLDVPFLEDAVHFTVR
ncbi:DUF3017 domain-containing protein [Streptomyces sp. CA-135486]|uniref:DUF3017 domain-containing protein n=1 Tax=Streptomyces sp. CA-135486 TaxID=3240049 RepID=UPI003D8E2FA4